MMLPLHLFVLISVHFSVEKSTSIISNTKNETDKKLMYGTVFACLECSADLFVCVCVCGMVTNGRICGIAGLRLSLNRPILAPNRVKSSSTAHTAIVHESGNWMKRFICIRAIECMHLKRDWRPMSHCPIISNYYRQYGRLSPLAVHMIL